MTRLVLFLLFIQFISDNTKEIYDSITINELKYVWNYESKRIEEIIRRVVFFNYIILAYYLRDNYRENLNTEIIFDNRIIIFFLILQFRFLVAPYI